VAPRRPLDGSAVMAVVMIRIDRSIKRKAISTSVVSGNGDDASDIHAFAVWLWERNQKASFQLTCAKSEWEKSKNPAYVWRGISVCSHAKIAFPNWVSQYLAECAERMLSAGTSKTSDLRAILPRVLGFPKKRGRGNQLKPPDEHLKHFDPAIAFGMEIANGAKPSDALRTAFDHLNSKSADKMDDKTLLSHIKKFYGVKSAPRNNAEWRKKIASALNAALDPLRKEFRELGLLS
jgi:hypothetical protein